MPAEQPVTIQDRIRHARDLRNLILRDPHRPCYHFLPPEGFFNDANGMLFHNGRYHLFYLARSPVADPAAATGERWVEAWDHVSSRDLVHWQHHPTALTPTDVNTTPNGYYSGGAIRDAPRPTLIYHVPAQGTCIAVAEDDDLNTWRELPANPVIPMHTDGDEFIVFDPCAWYEDGTYFALVGNTNNRAGYEGDSTSLFKSTDLEHWTYEGPFYKSRREWTDITTDCACPDFFPLGDQYMLLMHGHRPDPHCHYYLGDYADERFHPTQHGRMCWPGGHVCAPETFVDDRGRRIFLGWVLEARPGTENWASVAHGWGSVMSLPRVLSLFDDGTLRIEPPAELATLRTSATHHPNITVPAGKDLTLDGVAGDALEIHATITGASATSVGIKVRCSPDGEEQTVVRYTPGEHSLSIDGRASSNQLKGDARHVQTAPLQLPDGSPLDLRVFVDRSVLEVFANGRQCMTQRMYPSRVDSLGVRLFADGGSAMAASVHAWTMARSLPW